MKDLIQSKFVKDFSFLTLSSFFSRVLLLLRDFYLASVLGPAVYGVWVQIIIILNYLLHLPLGFQHLASREIPFYEGANQTNKINQVYSLVFVVTFSTFFIYTIVVCLFKNSLFPDVNNWIFVSLFLILSLVYSMNANLSILLRASQQFSSFSIGSVVLAILALILMIILVPSTGIYGALISFLTGMIIVSIYWYRKLHYKINLRNLSFFYLESKYKASLNLFFVSLIGTLIISGDRLIVVYFYDSQSIGYYGLGFILTQGIFLIVTPINQAILPRLSKAFGNTNNIENQKPYFLILTKYLGFGVIFFSGSIFIVIELVIFFF